MPTRARGFLLKRNMKQVATLIYFLPCFHNCVGCLWQDSEVLGDLGGLVNLFSYSSVGNRFFPFSFSFSKQNILPKGVCFLFPRETNCRTNYFCE